MSIELTPLITEKMTAQSEKLNRYGFVVSRSVNKVEIKKAVEKAYGVVVTDVNTMNYAGKRKSRYTKTGMLNGKGASFKKAVVTVAEGDTIDFYSNI